MPEECPVKQRFRASVIVPTFNRCDLLRELLDTLAGQALAFGDFEVVLSDDGSKDDVRALQSLYVGKFAQLKFLTGPNGGPGIARNRGVAGASADVLVFVDSDCLVEAGWLEALVARVEGGARLVFGPTRSAVPALEPFVHSIVSESELTTCTNMAVLRSAFVEIGGFRPEISRVAEDWDFVFRARARGIDPARVSGAVVLHPPRLRRIRIPLASNDWLVLDSLRAFYEKNPSRRPEAVSMNRRLLMKGAAKALVVLLPLACAGVVSLPTIAPLGLAAMIAHAVAKRARINRRLSRQRVPLRVPLGSAIKYGLLQPVQDLIAFAARFRAGMGWLW